MHQERRVRDLASGFPAAHRTGASLALISTLLIGLTLSAPASPAEDSRHFTLQPSHVVKRGIGWANDRFSVGIFDTFTSPYHDNVIRTPTRAKINPESKAFHDLSIKLSAKLNRVFDLWTGHDLSLELLGTNLTNQDLNLPIYPSATIGQLNTLPGNSGVRFDFTLRLQL